MKKTLFSVLLLIVLMAIVPSGAQDSEMVEMPEAIAFFTESLYGDMTGYEEFIHPEWQWFGNGELQYEGHEGYLNAVGFWSMAFPDVEVEVQHLVGEGDVWAIGWYMTGTNTVDFPPMGVTATGNSLEFYANAFIYLEDGMVKDCYLTWDWITWFDALGMPYGPEAEED